jgi:hypothetical protein
MFTPMNETIQRVEKDGMPPEVATELLLSGSLRYNRERKVASAARSVFWESTRQKKDAGKKLQARLDAATLAQLGKWYRRTEHSYIRIQHKYQRVCAAADALANDGGNKLRPNQKEALGKALEQQKAILTINGTRLEAALMALEAAINRRNKLPREREKLTRTIFESMVIPWHKLVGVEVHYDPLSIFP